MSELGHCAVFWFGGLLAGVLLGWMLGRRMVGAGKRLASTPSGLQPCRERQSA